MSGPALSVVTPYGRYGPSSRVRVFEWLERISEPVELSSYISHGNADPWYIAQHPREVVRAERRLRRMLSAGPNRLLLHKEASPLSRGALEHRLLDRAELAVYDFDDALQWDHGAGGVLRRFAPKARKAALAVRAADRVIAGNPVLAEWACDHHPDVLLIPSCVAPERYRLKASYELSSPPRLGWIGSRDSEPYLELIAPALQEVNRRTGARLELIGTERRTLGALERMTDRIPWSEAAQFERLAQFDLCLAPMPDELYARGKSGYKLLQYAAAGVPVIASPIGVNERIMSELQMPSVREPGDWLEAILGLLERPASERTAMGAHARELVGREYSYDAWLPRWRAAVGLG